MNANRRECGAAVEATLVVAGLNGDGLHNSELRTMIVVRGTDQWGGPLALVRYGGLGICTQGGALACRWAIEWHTFGVDAVHLTTKGATGHRDLSEPHSEREEYNKLERTEGWNRE